MAVRTYFLGGVLPGPDIPLGRAVIDGKPVDVFMTEPWRQRAEAEHTALFGDDGGDDVTKDIPTGSYVGVVAVVANKGISVAGTPAAGYTATLDLSQDLRTVGNVSFATVNGRAVATDGTKLDGIQSGATANSTDAFLLARANHTGTQALSTISDVTMTAANLNSLDDGVNSTLHFHNTDRDRANHTGAQAISTVTGLQTSLDGKVTKDATITAASEAHAVTDFATTNTALNALGAVINEIRASMNA